MTTTTKIIFSPQLLKPPLTLLNLFLLSLELLKLTFGKNLLFFAKNLFECFELKLSKKNCFGLSRSNTTPNSLNCLCLHSPKSDVKTQDYSTKRKTKIFQLNLFKIKQTKNFYTLKFF